MSPEQRQQILDEPDNYPLRVTFLGKTGLLTFEEAAFLRENAIDFEVDSSQIEEILAMLTEQGEVPAPPRGPLLRGLALVVGMLLFWRRAGR